MRQLWAVPAALPDVPGDRGGGLSPRGRIDAMRAVQWRGAEIDDEFVRFMETCVQCRGCEPACPSGVPFGRLIEGTKDTLASASRVTPRWQRLAMTVLGHHRLLLAGSTLLAVAQRLRLVPRRLGLSRLPLRRGPRGRRCRRRRVVLFTGCVMDAWMRSTHRATDVVLTAAGATVDVVVRRCAVLRCAARSRRTARRCQRRLLAT